MVFWGGLFPDVSDVIDEFTAYENKIVIFSAHSLEMQANSQTMGGCKR